MSFHCIQGFRRGGVCLAALVFLASCAGTPDQFYMLSADGTPPPGDSVDAPLIGVGPVEIPDYIDRNELVFQSTPHRFEVPAEQRWAGNLDAMITRVLANNLGHRVKDHGVRGYPWDSGARPRYTLPVTIRQFHAVSGGDALLDVAWEIRDGETRETLERGARVFTEPLTGEGYEGVVAAESRLLAQLADAIAAMLP